MADKERFQTEIVADAYNGVVVLTDPAVVKCAVDVASGLPSKE
jgi:hypothetical protein